MSPVCGIFCGNSWQKKKVIYVSLGKKKVASFIVGLELTETNNTINTVYNIELCVHH